MLIAAGAGYLIYKSYSESSRLQRIVDRLDREDPGWRLEEIEAARPEIPDSQNSALVILAAVKLEPQPWTNGIKLFDTLQDLAPEVQLSAYQLAMLKQEYPVIRASVDEARKLKDMPRGRFSISYGNDGMPLQPHLMDARQLVNLLHYDALVRAQEGDIDGALASAKAILNTGRAISEEPLFISLLIRIACRRISIRSMERSLAEGQPSRATLESVQKMLQDEELSRALLVAARSERAATLQLMQAIGAGKLPVSQVLGSTPSITGIKNIDSWLDANASWLFIGSIKKNEAAGLEFLTRFVEIARLPAEQREPQLKELEARVAGLPTLARWLVDGYSKMAEICQRSEAELRCAIAALALERYRLDHGRWPDSLAALVPKYLREVPVDPYDNKSIRFHRMDDRVVVYAVGLDKQDNGGNIATKYNSPGTDVGFRLWDPSKRRQPAKVPDGAPPERPAESP